MTLIYVFHIILWSLSEFHFHFMLLFHNLKRINHLSPRLGNVPKSHPIIIVRLGLSIVSNSLGQSFLLCILSLFLLIKNHFLHLFFFHLEFQEVEVHDLLHLCACLLLLGLCSRRPTPSISLTLWLLFDERPHENLLADFFVVEHIVKRVLLQGLIKFLWYLINQWVFVTFMLVELVVVDKVCSWGTTWGACWLHLIIQHIVILLVFAQWLFVLGKSSIHF